MKIAIVGPGSIGLLLFGLLSRSKEELWLLDNDPERAARLKKRGIKIEGLASLKIQSPNVTSRPQDVSDANFWIICVKSYDTKNVISSISSYVGQHAYVLTLQNGVGNIELLSEAFGVARALGGVTNMGATLLDEGMVRYAGEGETVLGRLDSAFGIELKDLRTVFQKSKLPIRISKDVKGIIWSKLIINCGINALSAITRLKNGRLIQYEGTRRILRDAVTEAAKVAKKKRIKLIYDDVLAKVESVCEATSENTSSMLSDILNKKRTEIDFLNGAIVRQAGGLGIKTPVNELLVDIIKSIEASYQFQAQAR